MIKVVIDNNVIIDALSPNPQFESEAQQILRYASAEIIDGFINANSLTDIFYVLRKKHGADKAKIMLQKLTVILNIIGIDPIDCIDALSLPMNDFEDALIAVCAQKIKADYIVTRDEKFLKENTAVKIITPKQFIKETQTAIK